MNPLHKATTFLALSLLLSSALIFMPQKASATGATLTENFETDPINTAPTEPWYAVSGTCSGTGTCRATQVAPTEGTTSLQLKPSGAGAVAFTMNALGYAEFCGGGTLTFDARFVTLPSSGQTFSVSISADQTIGMSMTMDSAGAITMSSSGASPPSNSGNSFTVPGITVASGSWYTFQIVDHRVCSDAPNAAGYWGTDSGAMTFYNTQQDVFFTAQQFGSDCHVSGFSCNPNTVLNSKHSFFLLCGAGCDVRLDNIQVQSVKSPAISAPTVGAAATTTLSMTLQGFDTDPMTRGVVARITGSPQNVVAFDPITLAQTGPTVSNSCNQIDGVMAYGQELGTAGNGYLGFLDCGSYTGSDCTSVGATSPCTLTDKLKIRNPLMGDPSQAGTVCTDFCNAGGGNGGGSNTDFDLQTQTGGAVCPGATAQAFPARSSQISSLRVIPLDWSNGATSPRKNVLIGFAFSDTRGNVGVWAIDMINNVGTDESCGLAVAFSTGTTPNEIATWRALDGADYMAAVGSTTTGIVWRTDVTRLEIDNTAPIGDNSATEPNVAITNLLSFPSPYNLATSIGCAANYCYLLTTGGSVARIQSVGVGSGGTPTWVNTGALANLKGLTVSRDNSRVAYTTDSTHAAIVNATTGAVVGTITLPTGTYRGMRLSDAGNTLYVATSTKISRYDLAGAGISDGHPDGTVRSGSNQQCRLPNGNLGACSSTTTTTTSTGPVGSFFGVDPARLDPSGGGDAVKGGFFLSLMIILGFASVGAAIIPSNSVSGLVWGAGLGALLGFGWTVFLGTMPAVITFMLVVIGVAIIGFKLKANSEAA